MGLSVYLLKISILEVLIYEMLVGMLSLGQQKRGGWRKDKLVNSTDRDILLGNQVQNSSFGAFWALPNFL